MTIMTRHVCYGVSIGLILFLLAPSSWPRELTLDDALQRAVGVTSRSEIIRGNLEVAESNYFAEKVNFYLPEISINGSLPAYSVNESYRSWFGQPRKSLIKTTDFDFRGNIQLKQSLFSGGLLTVRGNLLNNRAEYPFGDDLNVIIEENTRQGFFDFELDQPFLKPSDTRNDLHNRKDDLQIARLTQVTELKELKTEVTEAYFGVLQQTLQAELTNDQFEAVRLQAEIDSSKFRDGVISEEAWLESNSSRLDAELQRYDTDNLLREKTRELAILLDFNELEELTPGVPILSDHPDRQHYQQAIKRYEESVDVLKAWYQYRKDQRSADYAASAHGFNGNLRAKYTLGRGKVTTEGRQDDDIRANSWQVSLDFTYPIWDGGASGAAVKTVRLAEEKARIEYERTRRAARAEIVNLINRLDVSYRKLQILDQQIELNQNKLDIADYRCRDGQISRITYLESKIDYIEARDKYLEELKKYLLDKIALQGKYIG